MANNTFDFAAFVKNAQAKKAAASGQQQQQAKNPLSTIWADEIELDLSDCGVIDGHMPSIGVGVSYGESGSGKSFVALDRACHVAAGMPWRGMAVTQGVVIYIAAEAPESIKRRIWTWMHYHRIKHLPVLVVQSSVDLLNDSTTDLVELVIQVIADHGRVAMIVVDTLARAMIGNENAPEDMGKFVEACTALRDAGQTFVLVVHHCGKDVARGARGHSSLRAATDYEDEITRNEEGEGGIRVTKSRDDEFGHMFGFHLAVVDLGTNPKGRVVTTCIVQPADAPERPEPEPKPKGEPRGAIQKILLKEFGKLATRGPVEEDKLRSAFILAWSNQPGHKAMAAKRYNARFNSILSVMLVTKQIIKRPDGLMVSPE